MARDHARILVVDDERFFREAICDALAGGRYEVETVGTAGEALASLQERPFAVLVLDIQLPDRSGLDVLRQVRQEKPETRVVVLSAHTEQEYVLEALRLGACDYLAKPLHEEELRLSVERAVDGFALASSGSALRRRLDALGREIDRLGAAPDEAASGPGQRAAQLVEAVARVLDASKTSLLGSDAASGELRVLAASGRKLELDAFDRIPVGEGIAGSVVARGEALCVEDLASDPRFRERPPSDRYDSSSFIVVPVRGAGRNLGALCATDRIGGGTFSQDDVALLRLFALPAAACLATPAASPPEDGDDDAELARRICDVVTREVDPERLLTGVLGAVGERLAAAPVSLYLFDATNGDLLRQAQWEGRAGGDRPFLPRGRGLTGTVLETGHPIATERPSDDPRFDPEVDTPEGGDATSLLIVPLSFRGKRVGCLRGFSTNAAAPSPRTAEVLGATLSAAVRNVVLYRSLVDSIEEVARIRREGQGTAP